MGFWGWYFIIVGTTSLVLVVYFWIRWYQLIATMHRDALDAKLSRAVKEMDDGKDERVGHTDKQG